MNITSDECGTGNFFFRDHSDGLGGRDQKHAIRWLRHVYTFTEEAVDEPEGETDCPEVEGGDVEDEPSDELF